ncbi:MAG TPA: response regulator, partial [Fibrobacteraceae bacterium]|nr:response regulator [Fibrobacteraceae bacterium]
MNDSDVLVIEDESDIRELLVLHLQKAGFRVRAGNSGEDGLSMIRQEAPDLLLLDLMLPGIDGLEVCRRLKANGATFPIIMV